MAVIFCRHCGRKVSSEAKRCIYCGLDLKPTVMTMKCPFCAETIRADAMKCKHCGEFLDGGSAPTRAQDSRPVQIFIIDKAVIGGSQDLQIQGGRALDADVAKRLPPETVQAIEANDPKLLRDPRVKLLEAPSSTGIPLRQVEDRGKPGTGIGKLAWLFGRASRLLKRPEDNASAGQRAQESAEPTVSPQPQLDHVSTRAALPQASCPHCGFAVEPGDMFCYNCGEKVGEGKPVEGARRPKKSSSLWATISLFVGTLSGLALALHRAAPAVLLAFLAIASGVIGFRKIARDSWRLSGKSRAALGVLLGAAAILLLVLRGMGVLKLPFVFPDR